ncbi:hypothetical protein B0T26DRAFT_681605 [Lasiosphaeria miniovina]|uniref:Uncharacterized protein n=1 Tax=Lasiosphaeria miniovina TaxID=1954250 RepID=A0AA40DJT6_9PEZI|nr:uncharacterized protein B0T26DRAFT_681605 [Lasiosphaeria miniovina]KAK0703986.1 hypothetical protein B0T26DRAFT_681605 [Lasiosphaeria miniovina]
MAGTKRKLLAVESDVIHDLSDKLEYRVVSMIQSGRDKKADVLVVEIRQHSPPQPGRRPRQPGTRTGTCVLKTFPRNVQNDTAYANELAANAVLSRSIASSSTSEDDACQLAFNTISSAPSEAWPLCLGRVHVAAPPSPPTARPRTSTTGKSSSSSISSSSWTRFSSDTGSPGQQNNNDTRKGLLFEHLPDLRAVTAATLVADSDAVAGDIMRTLVRLHALNILHRDHVQHAMWPAIGFCNLFLYTSEAGGEKKQKTLEVVVLDFGGALVLAGSERDQRTMANERERMRDLLERARDQRLAVDHLSNEARKLLRG